MDKNFLVKVFWKFDSDLVKPSLIYIAQAATKKEMFTSISKKVSWVCKQIAGTIFVE